MFVPLTRVPLRIATMPDCSGTKSQVLRTLDALGLIVIAAPTSCNSEDCSRILRYVSGESYRYDEECLL
jgi:hypothetical protein